MHSRFSPSAAYRWSSCTASIPFIESLNLPEERSSSAAQRGTFLHSVREKCLIGWFNPDTEAVGYTDGEWTVSEEDVEMMMPGMKRLRDIWGKNPSTNWWFVEGKIDLTTWIPNGYGTADCVIVNHVNDTIYVDDFKAGSGNAVSPVDNLQLMLYAAGAIQEFGISPAGTVVLSIDQPWCGGIKEFTTSASKVLQIAETVGEIARRIEAGEKGEFVASEENCKWCPAFAQCPENRKRNLQLLGFHGKAPKLPTRMTARQRSKILRHRDEIERWLKTLHEEAMADALAGRPVPGFKVVEGRRGNRRWADEVDAEAELQRLLGEKAYTTSLISPAQAEKRLGDAIPATVQPPGKPILVEEGDPRPSLTLF